MRYFVSESCDCDKIIYFGYLKVREEGCERGVRTTVFVNRVIDSKINMTLCSHKIIKTVKSVPHILMQVISNVETGQIFFN